MEKPKRKYFREKIGMVFRVDLKERDAYAYGQIATDTKYIFFDHIDTKDKWIPVEEILEKPMAFYATVDRYVLKEDLWEILGIWPVKPENQVFPEPFGYDPFKKTYTIFKNGVGNVPCTLEDTYGRECLASWGHGSIEQRLRDHFAGRPNYDVVRQRSDHLGPRFMSMKEFYKQYNYDFHWLDDEEK